MGMKRNTRSWVPGPWPLRMDRDAAYWPQAVGLLEGDRRNLPTAWVCGEMLFKK